MIERDTIFPQIHFDEPNPKIPWGDFNVKVSSKKLRFIAAMTLPWWELVVSG